MAEGDSQDDGFVLADKPAGRTSHDITTFVRRELGVRKAGHAGHARPVRDRA